MKILFVDHGNAGRSQIAQALFNKISKKSKAFSAGTHTERWKGKTLSEFAEPVVKCMSDFGFDLSKKITTQLTLKMVNEADKIIIMEKKEYLPDYLKNSPKAIFCDIANPINQSYEFHCKIRDQIKVLIEKLVKEIE